VKRLLDIIISSIALIVFFPFGLIIAIILKLTGEHYIFYVHPRIGKNGKRFGFIKFATMLKDSPNLDTGDVTVKNDPRVLPLGHFLRKTKINELPQIINVLKGDMSIIGPRPLTPKNFNYYSDKVKEVICRIRPGLSGVGSIIFRDEETMMADSNMSCHEFYKQHIAPYKGELETWYQHNRSLWVDMMLVFLTAWVIVFPKTNLIVRLFKSMPQRPVFLVDESDRKGGKSLVRAIEDAPGIVEIGPTVRRAGQSKALR
jgi:lipopolysaccharide/colanic/teichoic acid biosynthesis glycosyltransferase